MEFLRDFGFPELLIILVIIVVLFGPGRIGKVAGELGKGIRLFKDGLAGKDEEEPLKASETVETPKEIKKETK
jgi:sec-independent protein translocase protein TatA